MALGVGNRVEGKCVLILGEKKLLAPTEFLFLLETDLLHPLETINFELAISRKLLWNSRINLPLRFS